MIGEGVLFHSNLVALPEALANLASELMCDDPVCNCHRFFSIAGRVHCPSHADTAGALMLSVQGGFGLAQCLAGCEPASVRRALQGLQSWPDDMLSGLQTVVFAAK